MVNQGYMVAVVGAGPAGIYAAEQLAEDGVHVALINRDIKPGGLAEYGIYYAKHKMKEGLRQQFRQMLAHPNIHYYGKVTVGCRGDLTLADLQEIGFQAIVVAVGAQGTKWLGLPGENLRGVYHAKDLVYYLNKLPPYSNRQFLIGQRIALVGVGNVMVDMARWLIHDCKVAEVTALARRSPADTKFTKKEFETIFCNLDVDEFIREIEHEAAIMRAVGQNVEEAFASIMAAEPETCVKISETRFAMRFLSAPNRILDDGNGRVAGLEVDVTTLDVGRDGETLAKPSGVKRVEAVDTIIFCIGDKVDESFGLPVEANEFVKNPEPRYPVEGVSYEAFDPHSQMPFEGVFVVGWARKASAGLVGLARKDGINGSRAVGQYLRDLPPLRHPQEILQRLEERLAKGGILAVSKEDWQRLEAIERDEAQRRGLESFKFDTNEAMLTALAKGMRASPR